MKEFSNLEAVLIAIIFGIGYSIIIHNFLNRRRYATAKRTTDRLFAYLFIGMTISLFLFKMLMS